MPGIKNISLKTSDRLVSTCWYYLSCKTACNWFLCIWSKQLFQDFYECTLMKMENESIWRTGYRSATNSGAIICACLRKSIHIIDMEYCHCKSYEPPLPGGFYFYTQRVIEELGRLLPAKRGKILGSNPGYPILFAIAKAKANKYFGA